MQQIRTSSLARIFAISPDSIWLQQTIGNKIYLQNEGGSFCDILGDRNSIYGLPISRNQNNPSSVVLSTLSTSTLDVPPASNGKPTFESIDVFYVDIDEATSNVPSLLKAVQEEYGDNYVLLTNDGLMIKDSPATRGM